MFPMAGPLPVVEYDGPILCSPTQIIDHLQTGDTKLIEEALYSLSMLLLDSTSSDCLLPRINQLLEACADAFTVVLSVKGLTRVRRVKSLVLLRLCSNVMDRIVGHADFGPRIGPNSIVAYIRAILPISREPLDLLKLPEKKFLKIMCRHSSFLLENPHSLLHNCLDRSNLFVGLLRQCTAILTSLKPHFGFLIAQLAELNQHFDRYLKYQSGDTSQLDGELPGKFENLNVDLILYDVNQTSTVILNSEFTEEYESQIAQLIETLEHLLDHLIVYMKATGQDIMSHFVLVTNLEESVPYQYVTGQLEKPADQVDPIVPAAAAAAAVAALQPIAPPPAEFQNVAPVRPMPNRDLEDDVEMRLLIEELFSRFPDARLLERFLWEPIIPSHLNRLTATRVTSRRAVGSRTSH